MKFELDLTPEEYQQLTEILEKARSSELNAIQDINDPTAFDRESAINRIQDDLAIQRTTQTIRERSTPSLDGDHHDLYARASDFLNRNDIESIFISGSVDSTKDREPDIHITRRPSGRIHIDTDDGSGEGYDIYSSHIGIDGTDYPSPSLASSVTDEQMTRLDAVLSGEVDIQTLFISGLQI